MTEEELQNRVRILIQYMIAKGLTPDKMSKRILTLIRESGLFMDTDMVKGLMFEKCAKCREKNEGQSIDHPSKHCTRKYRQP